MKRLIAIVGPTGIGKSSLAVRLAQKFNGEIINADSRQVYRHMDIGTAKPGAMELTLVPHHIISIINPDEPFSLSQYQQLAYQAIADIHRRGKLPFLVGGSGLYVWAVLEGWRIPHVPPDPTLRQKLEQRAVKEGAEALYRELSAADPAAAQKIDPRNVRRVIRALEVIAKTGTAFSRLQSKEPPPFAILIIGLTAGRAELYRLIDERIDRMMTQGLVKEVEKLKEMGYDFNLPALSSIGYKQIGLYLKGKITLAEAAQQMKYETHRFARHQYAWFKPDDKRIRWFDMARSRDEDFEAIVTEFIASGQQES